MKDISWAVIPLVAGLFVLVEALETTGVLKLLAAELEQAAARSDIVAGALSGILVAFGSDLVNNLPAGLLAGAAVQTAHVPDKVAGAILVGVDLGPNLSVTGSLATILWLTAIRREGEDVSFWTFLKLGTLAMPPALGYTIVTGVGTSTWGFGPDGTIKVPVESRMHANNGEGLLRAAIAGLGLVYGPQFIAADALQR